MRSCYEAGAKYIKKNLPLEDAFLKKAEVCDIQLRTKTKLGDLMYFVDRYPCLIPDGCTKDKIASEFALYQAHDVAFSDNLTIDKAWVEIGKIKDEAQVSLFSNLAKVVLGILSIPHSNACCERIFSMVRKNKTAQRAFFHWKRTQLML